MKKIISYIRKTVKEEKAIVRFVVIIFFIGLISGSLFLNFITEHDKNLLINQIVSFFNSIKKLSTDVFGMKVFYDNFLSNFIQLAALFVLGLSMIGIIAVIVILFFKGFMIGTSIGSIILKYQLKGVIGSVLYAFPVLILNVFIYLFMAFFAVYVSKNFVKALIHKDTLNFKNFFGKYLLVFLINVLLIGITSLLDSYLTPLLLKLFTFIV
ncbi:MAG: hypothetical protein RSA10_03605 [Bacilli bacterium]